MSINRRTLLGTLAAASCTRQQRGGLTVETVATGLNVPWSGVVLPDERLLISEKRGSICLIEPGQQPRPVGTPANILHNGDSGLLGLALDPDFETNGALYAAFTEGDMNANRMAIYRARWTGDALVEDEVIYRVPSDKQGSGHSGGRIAFLDDGTFLVTTGEGYDYRDEAQNLSSCLGKVLRLDRNGAAPADNPFVGRDGAAAEVYTLGHRNPLGIVRDPREGAIWLHEMGPRGGDELNRLSPGANFGWPRTTWGTDYDGTIISPLQQDTGVTDPVVIWNPSISPSGLALYLGDAFPEWRGDFFVGALSGQHLRRVRLRDGVAVLQEILLHDRERRIREVIAAPDGSLYVMTDDEDGEIWRLRPG